ncbi:MAG: hypothetical protein NDJ24_01725 [Alphaproteobacteria bacterium]|nr:hypothetical protein [Alphaproteobacteria bacterium]
MTKLTNKSATFGDRDDLSGAAYVERLRDHLLTIDAQDIQYFDLKQLAEIQARYRNRVRVMVHHYRRWRADYEREQDRIEKVYRAYEGIFVRRQLADCWQLYLTVNRDYHELRRVYLANLRQPPHRRAVS